MLEKTITGICPYCGRETTLSLLGAEIYRCKRCRRLAEIKDIRIPEKVEVRQGRLFT